MKKSIIRITCFALILTSILQYTNKVLKIKYNDGIYQATKLYELDKNTVDVLILGSSHAFEDFNTGILWDEYGMASFIFGGSVQPMWNTYYYLKEALKTQKPELIILEGYMTTWKEEYSDDSRIIKNTYGLRWSKNKVDAIKVSSPKERWTEFLLEYEQYHTRYRELSGEDFFPNQGNPLYEDWKGFGCNMFTMPLGALDVSLVSKRCDLYEKTEEYYRKTIELAQNNNIPIVIIVSPYAGINEKEQEMYNRASDIASEYGVAFFNCNTREILDEMKIDFMTDAGDTAHLNYKGNKKFSEYIGAWVKENYIVSDRRSEGSRYDTWRRNADFIRQMTYDQELRETTDMNLIISLISNDDYKVILSIDGSCTTDTQEIKPILDVFGITSDINQGIWYIDGKNGILWASGDMESEQYIVTLYHDFKMSREMVGDGEYHNYIVVDNVEYKKVTNGINILIYDEVTQTIVDVVGFDMDDEYNIIR